MLVKLRNSRLFDTDPSRRLGWEYGVDENLWTELWKRYKVLNYTIPEMAEYFQIKSKKVITRRQVKRWIFLTEVFVLTKPARDMGAKVINTEMFGELEHWVVEEVTRGMKHSGAKKSNVIV